MIKFATEAILGSYCLEGVRMRFQPVQTLMVKQTFDTAGTASKQLQTIHGLIPR